MGKGVEIMGYYLVDGELWDEETGEYAGPMSGWITGNESPEDLALLVMRKRMDIEASIQAEKDKLDAITNNVVKMLGKHVARLEWLERQYNAQLQDYAMSQLPRKPDGTLKVKTWTCPYGTVAFRTVAERVKVVEEEEAVAWLMHHNPEAIKTKHTVLVSKLSDFALDHAPGLDLIPATESVTIKTV
jgi:O6-methylguanine-DNA--protein-cysteine methyltransferase